MAIDKRFLKAHDFEDYREFIIAFGHWAYTTDFTYRSNLFDPDEGANFTRFLREFIKDREE